MQISFSARMCASLCVRGIKNIFIVIKRTFFYYYYSPLFLILTTQITQMYLADTFYFLHCDTVVVAVVCFFLLIYYLLIVISVTKPISSAPQMIYQQSSTPPSLATCELYLFAVLLVSAFCTPSWHMNYFRRYSWLTDFSTLVWCVAVSCPSCSGFASLN